MFEPQGTYTTTHLVDIYECDLALRMKLSSLVKVMQQAGEDQLVELGMPYQRMREEYGMVFMTYQILLEAERMPRAGEEVTIRTCPMGTKGVLFFRQAEVLDGEGSVLVRFYTSWSLYDPEHRKVLRPSALPMELVCGRLEIDPKELRFRAQKGEEAGVRPVRYSDLDANAHVNNAVYYDIICDVLPLELLKQASPSRVRLSYAHQALPGRELRLYCAQEAGVYHLVGEQGDQRCFEAQIAFGG